MQIQFFIQLLNSKLRRLKRLRAIKHFNQTSLSGTENVTLDPA